MDLRTTLKTAQALPQKRLTKLGTVAVGIVETTPVVFNNRLLRFEWIRNNNWGRTEGVKQRRRIRTRFLRADFPLCYVEILANPSGFAAFCAVPMKKSAP